MNLGQRATLRVLGLIFVSILLSACAADVRRNTEGTVLLAAVVAQETTDIQNALHRGETAEAKKALDILIESLLSRVALAAEQGVSSPEFERQSKRAAIAAGRYWKMNPPSFAIMAPVSDFIREVCNSDEGCEVPGRLE